MKGVVDTKNAARVGLLKKCVCNQTYGYKIKELNTDG
jgi:hypothetical protein